MEVLQNPGNLPFRRNRSIEKTSRNLMNAVEKSVQESRKTLGIHDSVLKILIAVSGGIDSHALLHVLWSQQQRLALELFVVHVDHGLRSDSNKDAQFVEALAKKYSLPFLFYQAPIWDKKENLESWARTIRYQFFSDALKSTLANLICTAHHKNDQAETLLMRLLSGRLATASRGIAPFLLERQLLRPFLAVTREEIERYCHVHSLDFVLDSTNTDPSRTRNRIRQELIPLLAQYNPNIVATLSDVVVRLQDDEHILWHLAETQRVKNGFSRDREYFLRLPAAYCWRELRFLAEEQLGEEALKLGYHAFQTFIDYIRYRAQPNKKIDLGFGICGAVNEHGEIIFSVSEYLYLARS